MANVLSPKRKNPATEGQGVDLNHYTKRKPYPYFLGIIMLRAIAFAVFMGAIS